MANGIQIIPAGLDINNHIFELPLSLFSLGGGFIRVVKGDRWVRIAKESSDFRGRFANIQEHNYNRGDDHNHADHETGNGSWSQLHLVDVTMDFDLRRRARNPYGRIVLLLHLRAVQVHAVLLDPKILPEIIIFKEVVSYRNILECELVGAICKTDLVVVKDPCHKSTKNIGEAVPSCLLQAIMSRILPSVGN
jgi:hypothetical protein